MPAAKRLAASHEEVFNVVKRHKIHVAEELYRLAQERSAGGDHSLLDYCTGVRSMKQTLQATINAMWKPDVGIAEAKGGAIATDPELATHLAPLTSAYLQELKGLARGPPLLPSQTLPLLVTKASTPRGKKILESRASLRRSGQVAETLLFDHHAQRAEVVFRPWGGKWRLRDFYEVLATARHDRVLAGVLPSTAPEGGFRMPRTEAGWRSMVKARVASPRVGFEELTSIQRAAASAEMRFTVGCGALSWRADAAATADVWIDAMPEDPRFEADTLQSCAAEERLVRLWARGHVEARHLLALVRALEACKHAIYQTVGFQMHNGNLRVTGTRLSSTRHTRHDGAAFGAIAAQACAAEAAQGRGRMLAVLGNGRAAQDRPMLTRPAPALPALAEAAAEPPKVV